MKGGIVFHQTISPILNKLSPTATKLSPPKSKWYLLLHQGLLCLVLKQGYFVSIEQRPDIIIQRYLKTYLEDALECSWYNYEYTNQNYESRKNIHTQLRCDIITSQSLTIKIVTCSATLTSYDKSTNPHMMCEQLQLCTIISNQVWIRGHRIHIIHNK